MENGIVTNTALYNCLHILRHKYLQDPSLAGFGSFGVDELYLKLKRYRANLIVPPITTNTTATTATATTSITAATTAAISGESGRNIELDPGPDLESRPRYYVVALDLEKCYDNVDTSLLYDLVRNLLCSGGDSGTGNESGGTSGSGGGSGTGKERETITGSEKAKMTGKEHDRDEDDEISDDEDKDNDEDEGYMVHRYSVSHYISRLA